MPLLLLFLLANVKIVQAHFLVLDFCGAVHEDLMDKILLKYDKLR